MPVANKPILFYGIEAIRDAGIQDIAIIVGDTAEEVKQAVGDGSRFGVRVHYIKQDAPLGLAHAVKISRDYMRDDPFVMYLGDNLLSGGIRGFVDEFTKGKYDAQILLTRVKNPSEFGVAELKGDRVVGLEEKPKKPKSDYALVGVYMFTPSIFEATEKIKPSWRDELEITDAIQYLIEHDYHVQSHVVEGWWKDTGKLEDMLDANRMVLTGMATRVEIEAARRFGISRPRSPGRRRRGQAQHPARPHHRRQGLAHHRRLHRSVHQHRAGVARSRRAKWRTALFSRIARSSTSGAESATASSDATSSCGAATSRRARTG